MKKILELHRFFIEESKSYIVKFSLKDIVYYSIAYIKFMYGSLKREWSNRKKKEIWIEFKPETVELFKKITTPGDG